MDLAARFELERQPQGASTLRNDYNLHRFVPEWWFDQVSSLSEDWFKNCTKLNKARNKIAHDFKISSEEIFELFGVASFEAFKEQLRNLVEKILFKTET